MAIKEDVLDAIKNGTLRGGLGQAGQIQDSASNISMVTQKLPRYDVEIYDDGVWQDVPDVERQEIVQDLLDQRVADELGYNS